MRVTSNKILVVCNEAVLDTKNPLFSSCEYKMGKELLKFGDVEIEKRKFHSSKSPMAMEDSC